MKHWCITHWVRSLPTTGCCNKDLRAAARSQAGAPLSWTSEGADMLFVCERVRKAAANQRQPQRAERAIYTSAQRRSFLCERRRRRRIPSAPRIARRCPGRASERTLFSSASERGRQRLKGAILASGASIGLCASSSRPSVAEPKSLYAWRRPGTHLAAFSAVDIRPGIPPSSALRCTHLDDANRKGT